MEITHLKLIRERSGEGTISDSVNEIQNQFIRTKTKGLNWVSLGRSNNRNRGTEIELEIAANREAAVCFIVIIIWSIKV